MGLFDLGAVRGMQASQKMNRDQLKKHRKSTKDLYESYPSQGKFNEKEIDQEKLAAFEAKMTKQRAKQKSLKLIVILCLALFSALVFLLLFI